MPLKDNVIKEQSINDNNYRELKKLFPHAEKILIKGDKLRFRG